MIFGRRADMKHEFGNRRFWSTGYYVPAVGLNEGDGREARPGAGGRRHGPRPAERQEVRGSVLEGPEEKGLTPVWPASHGPIRNAA